MAAPEIKMKFSQEHSIKISITLNIQNFNRLCGQLTIKDRIESPIFLMGPSDEYKWKLLIYPKTVAENRSMKTYLSAFVYLVSSPDVETKGKYKLSVLNCKKKIPSLIKEENFAPGTMYGEQIEKTDFLIKYLQDDKLEIQASIMLYINKINTNKLKVIHSLEQLFKSGRNHNVVILSENNQQFKVHRCILAERSPVLEVMLNDLATKSDTAENTVTILELTIKQLKTSILKEILRFLYTGCIKNLQENAQDLLLAANKFLIIDLKKICEIELFKSLKVDNVIEILSLAESQNAVNLEKQAIDFIIKNKHEVLNSDSYIQMQNPEPFLKKIIMYENRSTSV